MLKSTSETELLACEAMTWGTTVHGSLVGSSVSPSSDEVTFTVVGDASVATEVAAGLGDCGLFPLALVAEQPGSAARMRAVHGSHPHGCRSPRARSLFIAAPARNCPHCRVGP
jgi:hypothetical protein